MFDEGTIRQAEFRLSRLKALFPFLLLLALVGCKYTDSIQFTGSTVNGYQLVAMASDDRAVVLVKSTRHPFVLSLPYSEDWTLKSSHRLPLSGFSPLLEMHVCVIGPLKLPDLNEEKYLRERLPDLRPMLASEGLTPDKEGLLEFEGHKVLYLRYATRPVTPRSQNHLWGIRRAPTDECYEIHFATTVEKYEKSAGPFTHAVQSLVGPWMFPTEEPPK